MPVTASDTANHLRARAAARGQAGALRTARLRARVPAAIDLLRTRYGATDVLLFGSLATGSATEQSDVDLAVRGIAPDHYFRALADLMALFCAPVDLVRLEEAPQSLLERIAAEGRRS
jgi:predicted nucleotidyltransferase